MEPPRQLQQLCRSSRPPTLRAKGRPAPAVPCIFRTERSPCSGNRESINYTAHGTRATRWCNWQHKGFWFPRSRFKSWPGSFPNSFDENELDASSLGLHLFPPCFEAGGIAKAFPLPRRHTVIVPLNSSGKRFGNRRVALGHHEGVLAMRAADKGMIRLRCGTPSRPKLKLRYVRVPRPRKIEAKAIRPASSDESTYGSGGS